MKKSYDNYKKKKTSFGEDDVTNIYSNAPMNPKPKPTSKSKKVTKKKSKAKRIWTKIGQVFVTLFLIGVIAGSILVAALTVYVYNVADSDAGIDLRNLNLNMTSIMYKDNDKTGEPEELLELHGAENRRWVSIGQIPVNMQNAVIAIEDQRFKKHEGVDWKRTTAAVVNVIVPMYGSRQGGSTITQQLVKNVTGDKDVSYTRKIREIVRALSLEKKFSKDEILEGYLNTIALANGIQGVQVAANTYFNKDVSELNLAECASIAGITNWPVHYDPFTQYENNQKRKELVLGKMRDLNFITQEEYDDAMAYKVVFAEKSSVKSSIRINSWYEDMVINDVINGLVNKLGYDSDYASLLVYQGGLKIYTCIDDKVQDSLEKVYSNPKNFPSVKGETQPQSSMMIMNYKGRILGVVGGIGEKEGNRILNRAVSFKRQIGSSMKPLGAYAPAIEYDTINWSTMIENQPIEVDGKPWPPNYGKTGYSGKVLIEDAVARSLNTIPVRIVQKLTPEKCFDFAYNNFKLSSLVRQKRVDNNILSDETYSALALGGLTDGLTLKEVTAAYQTFGNGGLYYEPYSFYKVLDNQGNELLANDPQPVRAISEDTAYIMNRLLTRVTEASNGTGKAAKFNGTTVFGKTGTSGDTDDTYDLWFCGGTPYYVGACWYGYDVNKHLPSSTSGTPTKVWASVMKKAHEGLEEKDFPSDSNVIHAKYCTETGLLANANCPNTRWGYYKKSNVPGYCTEHGGSHDKYEEPTEKPKEESTVNEAPTD